VQIKTPFPQFLTPAGFNHRLAFYPTGKNNKQLLVVSVMPDQTLDLEWENTRRKIPPEQSGAYKEIYHNFASREKPWLFYTRFKGTPVQLSPSLD